MVRWASQPSNKQFLKHVLGARGNTATPIVLAEFGRYPLCFHWWQQILRFHNINTLSDDECLIKSMLLWRIHLPLLRLLS